MLLIYNVTQEFPTESQMVMLFSVWGNVADKGEIVTTIEEVNKLTVVIYDVLSAFYIYRGRELGRAPRAEGECMSTKDCDQKVHVCSLKPLCTHKNALNWSTLKFH